MINALLRKPSRGRPNEKSGRGLPDSGVLFSFKAGFRVAKLHVCGLLGECCHLAARKENPHTKKQKNQKNPPTPGFKSAVGLGVLGQGGRQVKQRKDYFFSLGRPLQIPWFTEYEGRANDNCTDEESETSRD